MAGRPSRKAKNIANLKIGSSQKPFLNKLSTEDGVSKPSSDCPLPTSSGQQGLTEASVREPLSDCHLPTSSGRQGLTESSGAKPLSDSPLPTLSGQDVTKSSVPKTGTVCLPSSSSGQGLGRSTGPGYRPDLYYKPLVSYGSSDSCDSDQSVNHSNKKTDELPVENEPSSILTQWSKMFPLNKQTDNDLPAYTPISPKLKRFTPVVHTKADLKSSSIYRQNLFATVQDLQGNGRLSPAFSMSDSSSDLRNEAPKGKDNHSSASAASSVTVSDKDCSDSSYNYVLEDSNDSEESRKGSKVDVQKSGKDPLSGLVSGRKKKKQKLETQLQGHHRKSSPLPSIRNFGSSKISQPNMFAQKQSEYFKGSSSKSKGHNFPELEQSDHFEDHAKNQDGSKIKRVPLPSSDYALTRNVKENQKIGKHTNLNSRSQSPLAISASLVSHPSDGDDSTFLNSHQEYSDAPDTRTNPAFHKVLSKPNSHRGSVKTKTHLDEPGGTRGGTSQDSSLSRTPSNSKGHSFSELELVVDKDSSRYRNKSKDKRVFLPSDSALSRKVKKNQKFGKNINFNNGSEMSSSSDSDHNEAMLTSISPQAHLDSPARTEPLRKVQKSRTSSKSKELDSLDLAAFPQTSTDLPKFDVKEILKDKLSKLEKNRGRTVWTNLESGRPLTKQQRKIMVRVLVRWLYMNHASTPKAVTSDMKEGLAKSIVTDYPNLKCQTLSSENLSPWSHYYNRDANTGWIPNCARHIQKKYRSRKTTKKVVEEEQEGSSEYGSDQIEALGQVLVNLRTKQDIFRGMQACFRTRKVERKRGETIDFFLNKYPHFKHFDGEVIFQEYSLMFSEARDLQRPFASKLDKILALEPVRRMDLKYDDDILRALILLSHQLPHDIPLPKEKFEYSWAREEDLFVILEPNDNITDYVIERMRNSAKAIQPYSILVQSSIDKKITSSFIVLDSKELEIQCPRQRPLLHALSVLMQCYCVFNVLHPFGWRNTLHFVQHYFMNIREKQYHRSSRGGEYTSSSEMELWERLQ